MLKFIVLFFAAFAVFSPLFLIGIRKYTGRRAKRALGANIASFFAFLVLASVVGIGGSASAVGTPEAAAAAGGIAEGLKYVGAALAVGLSGIGGGIAVAMGYARRAEELALGDEWHGELHTGDMARRDGDGFYYIVGRKKRFIKLYGNRVGLDEVERLLAARFPDTGFACVGRDDLLRVFHDSPDPAVTGAAAESLSEQMHFPERVFQIRALEAIPKNEAGKTQYRALEEMR